MNHELISSLKNVWYYNRNWQMTGRSTAGCEKVGGGPVSENSETEVNRLFEIACAKATESRLYVFGTSGAW